MQTISLHGIVGDDGMLRLEVPFGKRGEEVEVVLVMQPGRTSSSPSLQELAGAIDDKTFVDPAELPFEVREPLQ